MKKLVFATNNKHKLAEIRAILKDSVEVVSLSDIDCHDDIPETADTLEGNALIKARHIYNKYGLYCFSDDTVLREYIQLAMLANIVALKIISISSLMHFKKNPRLDTPLSALS